MSRLSKGPIARPVALSARLHLPCWMAVSRLQLPRTLWAESWGKR